MGVLVEVFLHEKYSKYHFDELKELVSRKKSFKLNFGQQKRSFEAKVSFQECPQNNLCSSLRRLIQAREAAHKTYVRQNDLSAKLNLSKVFQNINSFKKITALMYRWNSIK